MSPSGIPTALELEQFSFSGSEERFRDAAIASFRAQCAGIPAYGEYVRFLGVDPDQVLDWHEIPPVPASAFKSHDLNLAHSEEAGASGAPGVVFETSGTSISRPGRVRLGSTALYEASLIRGFRAHLLPDRARLSAIVFGPAFAEAPRSSLWFMVDRIVERLCAGGTWIVREGSPRWDIADAALARAAAEGKPVLLLGTTLLLMAYLDRLGALDRRDALPFGSRAMDTGGAKGSRAQFTRPDVEAAFERGLGIPRTHLVNEYGMAEMASQFYDDAFVAFHERRAPLPGKRIPPWVRTRVLDPETMRELPEGERGILVHYDLANFEIPFAIQTEDIGSRTGDRLIIEGRLLGAEARGCSLAFEKFLEVAGPIGREGA